MSEEKESTDMIVATLRLPISSGRLKSIAEALSWQYAPGHLTTRRHGEFLIVEKPGKESGGA